ncbi:class C sortase, partial [Enterococcus faecalis]
MKSKKKRCIIDGFMILLLIIGIGAFAYPFVRDALNNYLDQQIIAHYQAKGSQENSKEMAELQEKMEKKNHE